MSQVSVASAQLWESRDKPQSPRAVMVTEVLRGNLAVCRNLKTGKVTRISVQTLREHWKLVSNEAAKEATVPSVMPAQPSPAAPAAPASSGV